MLAPIDVSTIRIETPRLIIRPWRESDLQDFYEYAKVDGVGQMAGWAPHASIEKSKEILELFLSENKTFALEFKEFGKVIGSLGLEDRQDAIPLPNTLQGREIGYVLSRDYWGRGLMQEAVKAVTHWLFSVEKLDFLIVGHFDWNSQSRRVIEKCGFQYVKTIKFETRYDTVEDSVEYILYHPERRDDAC